jgi:seryl-tRNA synthetase
LRVPESKKSGQREVIEYAYNLRSIAQFLATATPSLLEVALGFDKVVGFINPLLHEMVRVFGELNSTLAELEEVRSKCERLESSLQTYVKREEENVEKYFSRIQFLQKKLKEAEQRRDPSREVDKPMTQESLATSNKLSLPLDALWKREVEADLLG